MNALLNSMESGASDVQLATRATIAMRRLTLSFGNNPTLRVLATILNPHVMALTQTGLFFAVYHRQAVRD